MNTTELVTIVALGLNAAALWVLVYQTRLTGKSLRATERSMKLSIKTMQVEMLPSAGWAIKVRADLEMWIADLQDAIQKCKAASGKHDVDLMKALARSGLGSPHGLVSRYGSEHAPRWLSTIWLAVAQYYYDAKAPQTDLWNATKDAPLFNFVSDFVRRCEDSVRGLQQLLGLIDDVVPDVYLNCPASVNDDRFLD